MGVGRNAPGRGGAASGMLLALAAALLAAGSASEYDYVSFQSDIGSYQSGRFYTKPPQCVDIPVDLRLCHNVGYKKMVLPNLLEHETMAEVKQQASSWVPLLNKNCHMGTQVFLCSLFAPVCLDRPIYPCRWLCEAVRDSCEPVMQFFGFYWPEMLKCDKFPEGDVCIAMTPPNATEASRPQGKGTPSHARESPRLTALAPGCRGERPGAAHRNPQGVQTGSRKLLGGPGAAWRFSRPRYSVIPGEPRPGEDVELPFLSSSLAFSVPETKQSLGFE